ncbi:MAG: glycogen synthase GlgA [Alphaproteobacteria bacterium]|nr:glycogen synthase GlgA [Alphaproteobacteria bacterium]
MTEVLSVASEVFPLVKTGGLADVAGALPAAVAPHGVTMTTLVPGYPAIRAALGDARPLHRYDNLLGVEAQLLESRLGSFPLLVLDAPALFQRSGGPYGDSHGVDWTDNWRRFAALGRAAADLASGLLSDRHYDILHAHDWQAAMGAAYLSYAPLSARRAASVVTVHNIAFQGRFDRAIFDFLGLPPHAYAVEGVEYYGGVGFLKAGLYTADAITTVSPTYAREIRMPEFGMGLQGLIATRQDIVSGIVNGIDPAIWNPQTDTDLVKRYTSATLANRKTNKTAVEAGFNLSPGDGPLFTVVSRITWQKGMDVLAGQLDVLVAAGARLALLGTGEAALEAQYRAAAARHPGRIGVAIGYNEKISHLLQGGADAILIPSRFEPCGLTQLYGLAYGCVPVASRTGGLADTIVDANEAAVTAGVATGILFDGVTGERIGDAINRTVALYGQPAVWRSLQRQGMKADFSWQRSGARYAALYQGLLARAQA